MLRQRRGLARTFCDRLTNNNENGSSFDKRLMRLPPRDAPRGMLVCLGCAYENAVGELFFAATKREPVSTRAWRSVAKLGRAVFDYVEGWYNPYRLSRGFLVVSRDVA